MAHSFDVAALFGYGDESVDNPSPLEPFNKQQQIESDLTNE